MFDDNEIYPGGFDRLLGQAYLRQRPFDDPLDALPPAEVDLDALAETTIGDTHFYSGDMQRYDALRKYQSILGEFRGQSELFAVHAMSIAMLRRSDPPDLAKEMFHRIWREKGRFMARNLSVRWMISAAATFADHGETAAQCTGGMGLYMLFDMIKLHDSERRLSTRRNSRAFENNKDRPFRDSLAFDMDPYSLTHGDLDRNMLARLWGLCEEDETLRPLGLRMLEMVMTDNRSIFARVQSFKS